VITALYLGMVIGCLVQCDGKIADTLVMGLCNVLLEGSFSPVRIQNGNKVQFVPREEICGLNRSELISPQWLLFKLLFA